MKTSQLKTEQILQAHRNLMAFYVGILRILEDHTIKTPYAFDRINPKQYLKNKDMGYYERFQIFGMLIGYYSDKITDKTIFQYLVHKLQRRPIEKTENMPVPKRTSRRLLTYFFKTHMRKKLDKIHRLYLREIILLDKDPENFQEVEKLRTIDSDVMKYSDILPNPARVLWAVIGAGLGAVGTVVTVLEFSDLKPMIMNSLHSISAGDIIGGLIVSIVLAIPIMNPMIQTFAIKRALLLRSNSWYDYLDHYQGKGDEVYQKSIYKLEDNLFETLEAKNDKPKEVPIDLLIPVIIRGIIIGFFTIGVIQKIIDYMLGIIIFSSLDLIYICIAGIGIILFGFFGFVVPYLEYGRRKKHSLL